MSFWGRVKETVREVRTGTTVGGEAHRAPDGSVTTSRAAEGTEDQVDVHDGEPTRCYDTETQTWAPCPEGVNTEAGPWPPTDRGPTEQEVADGDAIINEDGSVSWSPTVADFDGIDDEVDHDAVAQELADRLPDDWADNDGFVDDDHEDQGASFDDVDKGQEMLDLGSEPNEDRARWLDELGDEETQQADDDLTAEAEGASDDEYLDEDYDLRDRELTTEEIDAAARAGLPGDAEKTAQVEEDAAEAASYRADAQAELDDEAQEVTQETQVAEKVAEVEAKTADLAAQWDEIFDEADVPELTEAEQVEQDARDAAREEALDLREAARDEKDQAKQQEMVAKVRELEDAAGVSEPEYAPTTEQQEAWKEQGTTRDEATTTVDHTDEAYVSGSQGHEETYTVEVTRNDAAGPAPTETTTDEGIEQGGVVEVTSAVTVVVAATTSGDGTASNYHAEPANAATTTGGTTATSSSAGASSGMCM